MAVVLPRWNQRNNDDFELVRAQDAEKQVIADWYQKCPIFGHSIRTIEFIRNEAVTRIFENRVACLQANFETEGEGREPEYPRNVLTTIRDRYPDRANPDVSILPLWFSSNNDRLNQILRNGLQGEEKTAGLLGEAYYHTNEARYSNDNFGNNFLMVNWVAFRSVFFSTTQVPPRDLNDASIVNFSLTIPTDQNRYRLINNDERFHIFTSLAISNPNQILPKFLITLQSDNPQLPIPIGINEPLIRANELIDQDNFDLAINIIRNEITGIGIFHFTQLIETLRNLNNALPRDQENGVGVQPENPVLNLLEEIRERRNDLPFREINLFELRILNIQDRIFERAIHFLNTCPFDLRIIEHLKTIGLEPVKERLRQVFRIDGNFIERNRYSLTLDLDLVDFLVSENWYPETTNILRNLSDYNLQCYRDVWERLIDSGQEDVTNVVMDRCIEAARREIFHETIGRQRYDSADPFWRRARQAARRINALDRYNMEIRQIIAENPKKHKLIRILRDNLRDR